MDKRGAHHLGWGYNAGMTEPGGYALGVLVAAASPHGIVI